MSIMEKPRVVDKLHKYRRNLRKNGGKVGRTPRQVAIDYNNACNFRCEFCYEVGEAKYNTQSLSFEDITRICDEADALGVWEIILQGGELLINVENTKKIIAACGPERFKMVLITNGYFLSEEVAKELAAEGLDGVGISVSSLDEEEHDRSRKVAGAHKRALEAFDYAKNAGLDVWAQVLFGHHNAHSKELYDFLDYLKERDISSNFFMAMPYGAWKDNYMDAEDLKKFKEIRKNYKCLHDLWDEFDRKKEAIWGCWAVNRIFVTPMGDVLPCPFIIIKIGNIKEQSLKEIIDYGFSIKYFGEYSNICLAAQNRSFRDKYLNGSTSMFTPEPAAAVFAAEDFIIKEKQEKEHE